MKRFIIFVLMLACLLFPLYAAAEANIPYAAKCIGEQLDEQMMDRIGNQSTGLSRKESQALAKMRYMIMGTTPANINNLNQASPLARQMTEEISRYLVSRGYRYDEIRKGKYIRFDQRVGEFILTREVSQLANQNAIGQAILAGTYVVSGEDVRFTFSILCTKTGTVLAKASGTVPITPDLRPMLVENYPAGSGLLPTTYTRLQ